MATDSVTVVGLQFKATGGSNVEKAFRRLGREIGGLKRNFSALSSKELANVKKQLLAVNGATANSINSMQAQKVALQGLRNMADVTGREFKELTNDIARLDAKMKQASAGGGAGGLKGRLKGLAKGAGAIAAGGIFGGPEGAIGGAIGLKVGGPAGAAVGAAIGAQVGMVRQSIGAIADYDAALELQRKALKLVIGDTNEYAKSQEFLNETSEKLAIPQDVIVRQFTSLTASVKGAGKETADAEKVFRSIAAGIRGTGGSLEDMKAAMRATSQVFSKGKVSAEELRQQLGERLPGAFTLFAESMDKTPAQLDKALEQGKVTLDDFMKFAEKLFSTYGKNAEILAQGPEAAGDRLKKEMSDLKDELGDLLRPIGAAFQTFAAQAVGAFNTVIKRVRKFQTELKEETLRTTIDEADRQISNIDRRLKVLAKQNTKFANQQRRELIKNRATQVGIKSGAQSELRSGFIPEDFTVGGNVYDGLTGQFKGTVEDLKKVKDGLDKSTESTYNFKEEMQKLIDKSTDLRGNIGQLAVDVTDRLGDAFADFFVEGKNGFRDLAVSALKELNKIILKASFMKFVANPILGALNLNADGNAIANGEVVPSAKGNVFAKNKIVPYAYGGIVNRPTLFPMKNGAGLMGEAGPEAILPLRRGKSGKLGVESSGGGTTIINVSVDATGSSVQGNEQEGEAFGTIIATAIQSQIVKEKRPGGLLN